MSVKYFAGCGAIDVEQAVGLKLADLFPPRFHRLHRQGTKPPPIPWADVIRALRHHLLAIGLAASDIARGKSSSIEDVRSLSHAAAFVLRMIEEVNDVER